jgi:AraC-like DNA-binding protein
MRITESLYDSASRASVVDECPFLYATTVASIHVAANPVPHLVIGVSDSELRVACGRGDDSADLSVAAVSRRIGYESEEAFSRAFRRSHGSSPGAWRVSQQPSA